MGAFQPLVVVLPRVDFGGSGNDRKELAAAAGHIASRRAPHRSAVGLGGARRGEGQSRFSPSTSRNCICVHGAANAAGNRDRWLSGTVFRLR